MHSRIRILGVFLKQLRRKLSVEKAESLLLGYGYKCDVLRDDYSSDIGFAAAVMGVDEEWLTENFGK